jgi:hypothetical protein
MRYQRALPGDVINHADPVTLVQAVTVVVFVRRQLQPAGA